MAHLGLALASTIGIAAYTLVLFFLLDRRLHNVPGSGLSGFSIKITVASVLAALAAFGVVRAWQARFAWQGTLHAFTLLVVASTVGLGLTALLAKMLRVRELDRVLARISR